MLIIHYNIVRNISPWNTLRLRQNGCHFPDEIFKCIFLNENVWVLIEISLKFVPNGPINNIPALIQIMAWRCPGDKPLSELMLVSLMTYICVTRSQCVKELGHFFLMILLYFHILTINVIFWYETGPIQRLSIQHYGYWWPIALAPGNQ